MYRSRRNRDFEVFHKTGDGFYKYQYNSIGHYYGSMFLLLWGIQTTNAFFSIIKYIILAVYYILRVSIVLFIDVIMRMRGKEGVPGHWYIGGPTYELPMPPPPHDRWHNNNPYAYPKWEEEEEDVF